MGGIARLGDSALRLGGTRRAGLHAALHAAGASSTRGPLSSRKPPRRAAILCGMRRGCSGDKPHGVVGVSSPRPKWVPKPGVRYGVSWGHVPLDNSTFWPSRSPAYRSPSRSSEGAEAISSSSTTAASDEKSAIADTGDFGKEASARSSHASRGTWSDRYRLTTFLGWAMVARVRGGVRGSSVLTGRAGSSLFRQ